MQTSSARPVVAIIGRPNVGKSSIFNRLAGRRIAIVHEEAGVTRDRLVCTARYKNHCFDLVDTGGLVENVEEGKGQTAASEQAIGEAVRRQVHAALNEAQAVIFVADAQSGVMPADEKTAALLRKSGLPVLLAANKADNDAFSSQAYDFEKFGFRVFPVSALHNLGFEDLLEALGDILPHGGEEDDKPHIRAAIVGRPNVGKSSLVNRMARSERVIVSGEPGTTRDSIAVPLEVEIGAQKQRYILIDTAGLRQRKKIKHAVESFGQMRVRESIASADVVMLVMDAAQGPTAHDKNIAARILEEKKGCVIAVNKWDLFSNKSRQAYVAALYQALPFMDFVPVVCVSARTGFNIHHLAETVYYVADQTKKNVSTSLLNQALRKAYDKYQPPLVKGGRLKIFYATQVSVKPITFLLFLNDPAKLNSGYEKYLAGSLRQVFGFEGAPIVLKYRKRKERGFRATKQ